MSDTRAHCATAAGRGSPGRSPSSARSAVSGLLVNLGVFNLVRHTTDLQVVRASVIATVVAIAFNYVGFRYFTYRDRDKSGRTRELTLFLLFSAVGLVIENGVLYPATYGFGWDSPLAEQRLQVPRHRHRHAVPLLVVPHLGVPGAAGAGGRAERGAVPGAAAAAPTRPGPPAPDRRRAAARRATADAVRLAGPSAVASGSGCCGASGCRNSAKTGGCCWSSSRRPPSASARSRATARPMPVELRPLMVRSKIRAPRSARDAGALVRDLDDGLVAGDAGAQRDRAAAVHQGVLDQRRPAPGRPRPGCRRPACPACRSGRWPGPRCGRPGATPRPAA